MVALNAFAQNIKTDKYELYLTYIEVNELEVAKSMDMTPSLQYFYEGNIEVFNIKTGKTTKHFFYFSVWDKTYKEFLVKDKEYRILSPEISFNENATAILVKDNKVVEFALKNTSNIDMAILSNMLIWLNNPIESVE